MDLTTLLSTTAGKAIVGAAVAAAGLGGLTAAGAVELPDLPGQAVEVGETPPNPDDVVSQTSADADPQADRDGAETDDRGAEDREAAEVETEVTDTEDGVTETSTVQSRTDDEGGELPGVDGQSVAADAQDGGVDGAQVAEAARAGTPAEDHVTGAQGDEDDESEDDADDADDRAAEQPGGQAGEHRPETAGRP